MFWQLDLHVVFCVLHSCCMNCGQVSNAVLHEPDDGFYRNVANFE